LDERRNAAFQAVALSAACRAAKPFYWEIGDKDAVLVSGSVGKRYNADTRMLIASGSKWIWAAYVVQRKQGNLSNKDISLLTMSSGYTHFSYPRCAFLSHENAGITVEQCFIAEGIFARSDRRDRHAVNRFYYNAGHFQEQAMELGLGDKTYYTLQDALQQELGDDVAFGFDSPQVAAGIAITPASYGVFLRKILDGQLLMHDALGTHAVCTKPSICKTALRTPIPSKESWHYSLGHWVEDDPQIGDGSFSSPGAFGFYPWIDRSKTYYGIVARQVSLIGGTDSVNCGRDIRRAWMRGAVVKSTEGQNKYLLTAH